MPDQIREISLPDIWRLFRYWDRHPPPGTLISILAQWVGWKPPQAREVETDFAAASARNADWFKDPARFFQK